MQKRIRREEKKEKERKKEKDKCIFILTIIFIRKVYFYINCVFPVDGYRATTYPWDNYPIGQIPLPDMYNYH